MKYISVPAKTKSPDQKKKKKSYQGIIEADVSLEATLTMFKFHNRHFSGRYRQDVSQT